MAKVSVILVLVGLTVMASAYSLRPSHTEGVQAGKQGVIAQLKEHGMHKNNNATSTLIPFLQFCS